MDFIEKVRKTHKTPAIVLTGFGMQQDVERAQQAGFDAHLTKTSWRFTETPYNFG
jgi:CheY-like chemotaxis protein